MNHQYHIEEMNRLTEAFRQLVHDQLLYGRRLTAASRIAIQNAIDSTKAALDELEGEG